MNIFFQHKNPILAARAVTRKDHINKMAVEAGQMMSFAVHLMYDGKDHVWYVNKFVKSYANHPTSIWVRESWQNYLWTYRYAYELCLMHQHISGKMPETHKTLDNCLFFAKTFRHKFPQSELTVFTTNFGEHKYLVPDVRTFESVIEAHRLYYKIKQTEKPNVVVHYDWENIIGQQSASN